MNSKTKTLFRRLDLWFVLILACVTSLSTVASAQNVGKKTVWNSSTTAPSTVWIDASAFWPAGTTAPDPCAILRSVLTSSYGSGSTYPNGAVIDARGLYNAGSTPGNALTCNSGTTPFDQLSSGSVPPPTTILLPAVTINIYTPWIVPNHFKIVGEGQNTILFANQTVTTVMPDMIEMGGATGTTGLCDLSGGTTPCSGIAIEHLFLDGNVGSAANGIVNKWAQAQSYVNDVEFKDLLGKGLLVDAAVSGPGAHPGGANSGPYTNLYYLAYNVTSCIGGVNGNCPICADIEAQTQGLHGLTCVGAPPVSGSSSQGDAAIYINASNNTVEDGHIEAFWDAVEIGDVAGGTVGNITVKNVDGASNGTGCGGGCGKVTNTVHICGSGSTGNCGNHPSAVKDVIILQVKNGSTGVTSVLDDMTSTSLGSGTVYSVPLAGIYVLCDNMGGGQFSRFSTSPIALTAPTWGVGHVSTIANQSCTTPGTLFSNTGGGSMTSVYVCVYNGGLPQWRSIIP